MSRNRRNQSAAIRFGPAIKALLLCLLIGGSGVGYVWQKSQIGELGKEIKKHELELSALRQLNDKMRKQLAIMSSPRFLEARAKELNLGLVPPQPSQIWRLPEPVATPPPTAESKRQYAAQQGPAIEYAMNHLPPSVTLSEEEPIATDGWHAGRMQLVQP